MSYKSIEEFSINAWPALQTVLLDGWLLRFADGYTKRSNSISALYEGGELSLADKIARSEAVYEQAGQPAIFKITPFVHPELEPLLEQRGYRTIEPSLVMELDDLSRVPDPTPEYRIRVEGAVTPAWVEELRTVGGLSERNGRTTIKLFERPLLRTGFFTLYDDEAPVACGLGAANEAYVGLFDIATHPERRNRGLGEQLLRHILVWAREGGTKRSCLMVLKDNPPANRLYEKLGYRTVYEYSYRQRI